MLLRYLQALLEKKSRFDPESVGSASTSCNFHSFEVTSLNISLAT
jgi:hypothetical protein